MLRHDTDPETGDERYYQEVRSRGALIAVCATIGGFGLLMLLGGFAVRLPHVGADEYGMLVFGVLVCLFAWRFWNITTKPWLILGPSRLTVKKMLGTRSWRYEDIAQFASFPTVVQATVNGRKGPAVPVHYLGIKTRNGKVARIVLPEHRGNQDLLKSLTENSLIEVIPIPIAETAAFEQWKEAPLPRVPRIADVA